MEEIDYKTLDVIFNQIDDNIKNIKFNIKKIDEMLSTVTS